MLSVELTHGLGVCLGLSLQHHLILLLTPQSSGVSTVFSSHWPGWIPDGPETLALRSVPLSCGFQVLDINSIATDSPEPLPLGRCFPGFCPSHPPLVSFPHHCPRPAIPGFGHRL